MATNITVKHYKDIVLEKPKTIIRNDALSLVLNISVFYMEMSLLLPPKYLKIVNEYDQEIPQSQTADNLRRFGRKKK